jgi:hypothetical protein
MFKKISNKTLISISLSALVAISTSFLTIANAKTLLDNGNVSAWKYRSFEGDTSYTADNGTLKAVADNSSSGYFYENKIQLNGQKLSWRWKVDQFPGAGNEKAKSGDDFAGRVYVLKKGLFGLASAKAIVYVWSENQPVGSSWVNPYTDKAVQVVVSSGSPGNWKSVQRDVKADFKKYYNLDIDAVDAVALMTDSDNSGGKAITWYDDINL